MKWLLLQLIKLFALPMSRRFERGLKDPQGAQAKVRRELATALMKTEYGKSLGLNGPDDFRTMVPIVDYDALAEWVERQKKTENRVLVSEPVSFYEKTSGSTGPAKYIPYTKSLRQSFTRMFLLWARDVVQGLEGLGQGRLYFSVSPSFDFETSTDAGVQVGLEDDADYLGGFLKFFMAPFFLMPEGLGKKREPEAFKRALGEALLRASDLEAVSVWNPSFFTVILSWMTEHREELVKSVGKRLSQERCRALMADPVMWTEVWPSLKFISCWADANAKPTAEHLASLFPGVCVQGKGLLATEAPMTIPLMQVEGGVPLVDEVYLEFEDDTGSLLELHELEQGVTYELIVSQKGGLSRYRMGDRVLVVSFYEKTPTLSFVGRGNRFSDLVGEKLNEDFVREVIDALPIESAHFRTLIPVRHPADRYVLLLDDCSDTLDEVRVLLEEGLGKAYHYRHARALGQLGAVEVVVDAQVEEKVAQYHMRAGKRWGDIKQSYLICTPADEALRQDLNIGNKGL